MARIGSRQLFYGPMNQVIPAATASRWVDALLKVKGSDEALASIAQMTGDASRDLPVATVNLVRAALRDKPELLALVEGEKGRDLGVMGRMFGEELPAGLVFA
jgi:hypothetical protein